ncbi:fused MFS/spermidine synthase [Aquisphaera insulae]|uniref:fused MFS/spermidine synthase n=1 Tax=Aquisphaera insulae TaxID=2712864 RepID=UPI0013ECC352|nr:fused MFS/spermidine synthase [Aquisphaera insulae]
MKETATPDLLRPTRAAAIPSVAAVLLLFTATGASGLMFEVVWTRMLGGLLGATTWSVMAVLVAYLGGLGLGAIFWGRRVQGIARPLRLFGILELLIGLYALAVPLIFPALGMLLARAAPWIGDAPAASTAARALVAVLALAPPTLMMGGTLPILARSVARGAAAATEGPGRLAGRLYAANTAGAVAGCLATGCLLIFWLGVAETNAAAALIDIAAGAVSLRWDRRSRLERGAMPASSPDRSAPIAGADAPAGRRDDRLALAIAAVSGFCGLAYEVLWTRAFQAAVTDDTTYAFTLMLTAYLIGHAVGAAAGARLGGGRSRGWRWLGAAQTLAASAALLSIPMLVVLWGPINALAFVESMTFWGGQIPLHLGLSLLVFAPSAFFLGASFSIAAGLYVGADAVGRRTGRLYGVNTLGAIAGAVAATAWLIPSIGTQQAVAALAVAQGTLGLLTLQAWRDRSARPGSLLPAALAALVVACWLPNEFLSLEGVYARREPGKLLALVEGSDAAVTAHQLPTGDRIISVNGVNVAGTNGVLRATQKLQGHLPVCLHPSPRAALQIGFGSGGTCYAVSLHPEVLSIEIVELTPDVPRVASQWFADINHGVLKDPRVRLTIADARSHVAVTDRTYDLILSDSTHPRFRGNAALYGYDYFRNCARRLRPGGILSTWLPLYGMSPDDVRGILRSLQAAFPHVQVWYPNLEPHENTILLASTDPIAIDPDRLALRLAAPPVARDLLEVSIGSTIQLLDSFLVGDRGVAELAARGMLSTDDHPRLEFLAPRTLRRRQSWAENLNLVRTAREPIDAYLVGAGDAFRGQLDRWYRGTTFKLEGQCNELEGRLDEALRDYEEGVRINPEDTLARIRLDRFRRGVSALTRAGTPSAER